MKRQNKPKLKIGKGRVEHEAMLGMLKERNGHFFSARGTLLAI